MKCNVWKTLVSSVDRTSFDFRLEEFFCNAFVNNHLLCFWLTIHNSISKICPKFQVLSSHFFEVDELLDEHWAKIVRSEYISTPIYVECDEMYQSKVCVQELGYIVSGLDIQSEQSENDNHDPAHKKADLGCEIRRFIHCFFHQINSNWLLSG